jgi:nucleotide-binding universal stress UspA family protein
MAHTHAIHASGRRVHAAQEATVVEFRNILCPIDLSEASMRALAYAVAFARWYDAGLTVLHVAPTFEPMQVRSGALANPVHVVYPITREEIEDELRRALNAAGAESVNASLVADAGEVAGTIVDRAARISADLVVIGTHGRGGFDRLCSDRSPRRSCERRRARS